MKNVPRIFIDAPLGVGKTFELTPDQHHYLTRVMRTERFLALGGGTEYEAEIINNSQFIIHNSTPRADPSGKWTFCFAPIKKIEDLVSGVVQCGAGVLAPVITERTAARHVNWERMKKIIIENAEQSGRNSIPELREPVSFAELDKCGLVYGDERKAGAAREIAAPASVLFVGPEGGFSDAEFDALDAAGAVGVGLGRTILRAEVAAVALCARCAP
ncbi:MAG: 16S rRNA (uracil(1498)-N(3))-methyltransferase [Rickettsiales bacterium]|jgi:16S rRNA (uracil1498-N3)-methyltransferase|nr:16S rRNA (uracil(1498)-N(3))-methyltransferase [Rickettsiales bacterium]